MPALTAKSAPTPRCAMRMPAMPGPTARAMLILIELSWTAEGTSSRATSSGTRDWYAGVMKTDPEPMMKVNIKSNAGDM